jgi:protein O-mannosyl-transferase
MEFLQKKGIQAFILILISGGFYLNTLSNKYALDDGVVITENLYTKKGIGGIKDLITHNLYYGYTKIKVGLYRPLSLVSHALEYEFFGENPFISHLVNLLLFVMIVLLLYQLLADHIFKEYPLLPFFSALLFAIHPIHTEAVANIKGRDELFSFLFLLLTLVFLFKSLREEKQYKYFFLSLFTYFLALISKENGVTFIAIIPLILYFFTEKKTKEIMKFTLPFLITSLAYLCLKFYITGFETNDEKFILNTPFLYANAEQEFATKIFVQLKYIFLLLYPHPLSYDYCYNEIPYLNFIDPEFWLASAVIVFLLVFALYKLRSKNILSFSILFYFISISIVSNFVFKIGAPMGERFLFQPSAGFSIAIAYLLYEFIKLNIFSTETGRLRITLIALFLVIVVSGFKTTARNKDWKDSHTLFIKDVSSAPNSIRTNSNAALSEYFYYSRKTDDAQERKRLTDDAISKYKKAISIDPLFSDPYINLLIIYIEQGEAEEAYKLLRKANEASIKTTKMKEAVDLLSDLYVSKGHFYIKNHDPDSALLSFNKATEVNENNTNAWYNKGGIYLDKGEVNKTVECWEKVLALDSTHTKAKDLLPRIKRDFGME